MAEAPATMTRDVLFFIASLACAAILAALGVLIPPNSLFWKWVLWGGVVIFILCAIALLLDIRRRRVKTKGSNERPDHLLCTFSKDIPGCVQRKVIASY